MTGIYFPSGRAQEYFTRALNHYIGCDHRCIYCYNKSLCKDFATIECRPRPSVTIAGLEKQLETIVFDRSDPKDYVLLSFQGDPYCHAEETHGWTRKILSLFLEHQVPTAILTKGGKRCLRDLDLFKQFDHIKVGASLTFANFLDSRLWENGATLPIERVLALSKLHIAGIPTFASFEPVVYPEQTIALMEFAAEYADEFKIGKLNHDKEHEHLVDWSAFGKEAEQLCKDLGKPYLIKKDLRDAMEVRP
jgi:DNA repair photolyase